MGSLISATDVNMMEQFCNLPNLVNPTGRGRVRIFEEVRAHTISHPGPGYSLDYHVTLDEQ